jgi:carboxyl-terminal processing protease
MSERNLFWLLGIAAASLFGFAVSYSAPTREKDRDYENLRLLVDVLHEVREKYVTELSPERERKLVEDMINGGLERLDPHSHYINPKDWKEFNDRSRGKFGGVGIQIGYDRLNRGHLAVVAPMPGTPAYESGILPDDLILKIDGKPTDKMQLEDAIDLIKGDPGQKVTLTVIHESLSVYNWSWQPKLGGKLQLTLVHEMDRKPEDVVLTRAVIDVKTVIGDRRRDDNPKEWNYFLDGESKIGYLRLTGFGEESTRELTAALNQLKAAGMRGLVLDLRSNPGGLLREAVSVSNLFLDQGRIVSTKGRNRKDELYDAKPDKALLPPGSCPIAVLVNRSSASASEIVAAALQDNGRAVVVGERSYGKGSVQDMIELENKTSRLKLTTAGYWRPSGKNIHRLPDSKEEDEWGVSPSKGFEVNMKDAERLEYALYRRDRDLPPAPGKKESARPDGKKKEPFVDRVLQKAVQYVKQEADKAGA